MLSDEIWRIVKDNFLRMPGIPDINASPYEALTARSSVEPAEMAKQEHVRDVCLPSVRMQLDELEKNKDYRIMSRSDIDTITNEIMPILGVVRGSIYLLEEDSKSLVQRLTFGERQINLLRANCNNQSLASDIPITSAFCSSEPVKGSRLDSNLGFVPFLAGALGESTRIGVLYAEFASQEFDGNEFELLNSFKAVCMGMYNCLKIAE